jgi:hypothetical protein
MSKFFKNYNVLLLCIALDSITNSLGSYMFAVLIYDGLSTKFVKKIVLLLIPEAVICAGNQNLSCEIARWWVYTEN